MVSPKAGWLLYHMLRMTTSLLGLGLRYYEQTPMSMGVSPDVDSSRGQGDN